MNGPVCTAPPAGRGGDGTAPARAITAPDLRRRGWP
ncbi:hypothetical protein PhaeoP14_03780 (plasmid) [Phaeobacter piscinae]|nr:hypothetical protein PhaeoP14_03780 [Phaeobacter piscinae]